MGPLRTSGACLTLLTLGSLRAWRSDLSYLTLEANGSLGSLDTSGPRRPSFSRWSLDALRASRPGQPLRALWSKRTLRPHLARWSSARQERYSQHYQNRH